MTTAIQPFTVTVNPPTNNFQAPLLCRGKLDAVTREVYEALMGADVFVEIVVKDQSYTVLTAFVQEARRLIAQLEVTPTLPIPTRTIAYNLTVPSFQPKISPVLVEIYRIFGVDTVDVVVGAAVYTMLPDQIQVSRTMITTTPHGAVLAPAPRNLHLFQGATFDDFYVGVPTLVVKIAAGLCAAKFVRAVNSAGVTYSVLRGPHGVDATLLRLGLYD